MNRRRALGLGLLIVIVLLGGFAAWLARLPGEPPPGPAPDIVLAEEAATLKSLQPPKRERPVVAIIGLNQATETTDYLMPYGILRRADIAEVMLVSIHGGPVRLYPALAVQSDLGIDEFDARFPSGADYVVVPAMDPHDDPEVIAWIRKQAAAGATIIGVCAGATVVAASGLLDGKRAVSHWYYLPGMLERHPQITHVADRRYVVDGSVATTTGISASMPMSLTLVEAIAGRNKADAVARSLGVTHWDARHRSEAFALTRRFATTVMANSALSVLGKESLSIGLQTGVDEVALALMADAWSRTYRSRAVTVSENDLVTTRNGARLIPDRVASDSEETDATLLLSQKRPAVVLDDALSQIAARYGERTAQVVAMQLEYQWEASRQDRP